MGELGMLCAYHRLKGGLSQVGILVRVHVMKFSAQVLIFFPCLCIPAPSNLLRTLTLTFFPPSFLTQKLDGGTWAGVSCPDGPWSLLPVTGRGDKPYSGSVAAALQIQEFLSV